MNSIAPAGSEPDWYNVSMPAITRLRERFSPRRMRFELFADLSLPHEVTAIVYSYPFHHIVIDNLLPQQMYDALVSDFRTTLAKGLSPSPDKGHFSRFELYDLYGFMPRPTLEVPYGAFLSESFFQMLESALARTFSRDTFFTFHHHLPNPEDNYIHNDYVYEFFADEPLENGVNPWYYQCDKHQPSEKGRPVVRGATSIFYLNNDLQTGEGGETAIFSANDPTKLVRKVEPVNNRLLAFDITPRSFHTYQRCSMPERNSFAQWYYVSEEDALARFPRIRPGGWDHLYRSGKRPVPRLQ